MPVAIVYASRFGQTEKIATRIAERLRAEGKEVALYDARRPPTAEELAKIDGVIVGSWVRGGQHMRAVQRFVVANRARLACVPSAFFSVSLLQLSTKAESRARVAEYVPRFVAQTGWTPDVTATFAGALTYTRFGWLGKRIMRSIWRREGLEADITRDVEYTRWDEVERFADAFARRLSGEGAKIGAAAAQ